MSDSREERAPTRGGSLGKLIASFDWSTTPLGPLSAWPQSLRTAIDIMMSSQHPMWIGWGREATFLYNDAYIPVLSLAKHPWALGRPAAEVWSEIWDVCGPLADKVFRHGEPTFVEDVQLFMSRGDRVEETYYSFSYSPIRDETDQVAGLFCPSAETSAKVIGARRLQTLSDLSAAALSQNTVAGAMESALAVLAMNPADIPFAFLYVIDTRTQEPRPVRAVGVEIDELRTPWLSKATMASVDGRLLAVSDHLASEVRGLAEQPVTTAVVLPLSVPGAEHRLGYLVFGINPTRLLDADYRTFFELVANQIAASMQSARLVEEEKRRADALADLDRAKTHFFSNVSHEFRTPLTLLLGPTEDALHSPDRALRGEALDTVYRNELRLMRLVNSLLDFSRIEAGRANAYFEPTDISALTRELVSGFQSAMDRAGIRLVVESAPIAGTVFVDREMWEKIVLNLVSNAFKFTFEGEITVVVRCTSSGIELTVGDTGVGIPANELPRVFERFHRIESTKGRTHEGSGIGLALVHELVRMHGGEIRVDSIVGRGTTFTVSLPFGAEHLPADQVRASVTPPQSKVSAFVSEAIRWLPNTELADLPEGEATEDALAATVLVADDNADMREYLVRLLRPHWHVETVPDGRSALERLRSMHIDLVLSDVMMPRLDGFGLLSAVRRDPELRSIPIVLLSARAGDEAQVEALDAGADDYLVKPFSARELVARIRARLEVAKAQREVEAERGRLRQAQIEAERANRAKDEFLAMLGHELRNPMAPIATALELLRLKGRTERELAIIGRQMTHLTRLVDDLLDISRITRGKLELRWENFEIGEAVVRAFEVATPLFEERRQRVELDLPADGLLVHGDRDRLSQVFANILTNASKYSEPHSVVRVRGERRGGSVLISITDSGVGFDPEMASRVFDTFYQEAQDLDRARGGLGLGLAIVKSLVELHKGSVSASSAGRGTGSEFVVELPLAAQDRLSTRPFDAATLIEAHSGRIERRRILVVDDNEDAAEMLTAYLETLGCEVRTTHDAESALSTLSAFDPDICMLDIGLPKVDGYELARELRRLETPAHRRKLVAVTGYGRDADREKALAAGFDSHLVKPLALDAVRHLVRASEP